MSKPLHTGKAAMNGLLSSLLARRGYSGAVGIFEGEKGLFKATSSDYDLESAVAGLGQGTFKIMECSLKRHASCGHTHSSIDGVLSILAQHLVAPEEVARVNVRIYGQALDLLEKVQPNSPASAKFCLPFCIATAVLYQEVGLEAFAEKRLKDPTVLKLMEKIGLQRDPALTALYPQRWCADVTLVTTQGNSLEARVEHPKGDPENPMREDEVVRKFQALAQGWPKERRDRLIEQVMNLENIPDVALLFTRIK